MISSSHGGKIIFISSISGHRVNYPQPQLAYNVSKAALLHMRNSLAAEWTQYGIHVNSISPGYMDTVLNEGEQLAPFRKVWADRNPMRRMGSPQELTGPVVLLCSDVGGSYINGADIVVDGECTLNGSFAAFHRMDLCVCVYATMELTFYNRWRVGVLEVIYWCFPGQTWILEISTTTSFLKSRYVTAWNEVYNTFMPR